ARCGRVVPGLGPGPLVGGLLPTGRLVRPVLTGRPVPAVRLVLSLRTPLRVRPLLGVRPVLTVHAVLPVRRLLTLGTVLALGAVRAVLPRLRTLLPGLRPASGRAGLRL